jgi:ribosomal protein S18 acetylase RimI-like enzyme
MMTGVEVRRATVADWRAVRSVRLRALADSPWAFGSTLEREQAFDDAEWQRRTEPGNWVLALSSGEGVGVAAGLEESGRSADERHLVAMWVAPEFRGTQVADALVSGISDWALASGASVLSLWVADGNDRARRFYERLGFQSCGERQPLPSNPNVSEERMALRITDKCRD